MIIRELVRLLWYYITFPFRTLYSRFLSEEELKRESEKLERKLAELNRKLEELNEKAQ
jgi:hypothetical protein